MLWESLNQKDKKMKASAAPCAVDAYIPCKTDCAIMCRNSTWVGGFCSLQRDKSLPAHHFRRKGLTFLMRRRLVLPLLLVLSLQNNRLNPRLREPPLLFSFHFDADCTISVTRLVNPYACWATPATRFLNIHTLLHCPLDMS